MRARATRRELPVTASATGALVLGKRFAGTDSGRVSTDGHGRLPPPLPHRPRHPERLATAGPPNAGHQRDLAYARTRWTPPTRRPDPPICRGYVGISVS